MSWISFTELRDSLATNCIVDLLTLVAEKGLSFVIRDRMKLENAPVGSTYSNAKLDDYLKVALNA